MSLNNKISSALLSLASLAMISLAPGSASAACLTCVNSITLPSSVQYSDIIATVDLSVPAVTPGPGFMSVILTGAGTGTTLRDQAYTAWCGSWHTAPIIPSSGSPYRVYSPYAPAPLNIPTGNNPIVPGNNFNMVNWILNNKRGTVKDVQDAIWLIMTGEPQTTPSTLAVGLANDAHNLGASFVPNALGVVGIFYQIGGDQLVGTAFDGQFEYQNLLLEVKVPGIGGDQLSMTLNCPASSALAGSFYSFPLVAGGGLAPYRYSIISGTLPSGLNLDTYSGTVSGVPSAPGTSNFTAQAADSGVLTSTKTAACGITVTPAGSVAVGDTATIGFWNNKNGQSIIKSLPLTPISIGKWLATTFPGLYGPASGYDMTSRSNAEVAARFQAIFKITGQKTQAQILAGAFAWFVTDPSLSGTGIQSLRTKFGFNSGTGGTGAKLYNIGSYGTVLHLTNNTAYSVQYLLSVADSFRGGSIDPAVFNALNAIFDGINRKGDII